jgi:hypothetical protein
MSCRLDNLQAVREAAGFSVTELARAINGSDRLITGLEQRPRGGTCAHTVADQIAAALGATREALGFANLVPE